MIKVENIQTWGWEAAIRGMRNPMNSWEKSDSYEVNGEYIVGDNDKDLMIRLIKGGTEHRKFLRMLHIQMDITAPLYWWKEYDTYKVSTVANSCSTMHKISEKEFTLDDFSTDHLVYESIAILDLVIKRLNFCREFYNASKDKQAWWQMIQLLPSSYNQRRTVDLNYETAMTIIRQRTGHKLDEWKMFCLALMELPYMEELYDA